MPDRPSHAKARTLRAKSTDVERLLWTTLRSRSLTFKFRRQHPVPPYVADFACVEKRLIIELDGGQHGGGCDLEREAFLQANGWRVLRYWNSDVVDNLEGVLADIVAAANL